MYEFSHERSIGVFLWRELLLCSCFLKPSFSRDVHMLGRWAVDRDLGRGVVMQERERRDAQLPR